MHDPAKRAILLKLGAIGDCVMVVPAAYLLYQLGYRIDWICGPAVRPLLECYSWIHVIPFEDRVLLSGPPWQRAKALIALWFRIAFQPYTLSASLYYDKRYRLLLFPVMSARRLAFSRVSRRSSLISGRNQADEYARLLLQSRDSFTESSLQPCRPDRLPQSPLWGKIAPRRIALVPSGASTLVRPDENHSSAGPRSRRWPVEHYVAMAHTFLSRGWEVVLLGGKEDIWARQFFTDPKVIDCIGQLTLGEVVSVCDTCDAVVSHDTGPLHLAGLSMACLVGIFGPTDPFTFLPRRPYALGLWGGRGFACRPCYDGRDFAPCTHNGCMHQVTVADALAELDRLLDERDRDLRTPWRVVEPNISPFVSIQPSSY